MIIDSHVHLWAKKYYGDAFKPTSSEGRDISYASGFPDVDFDVLIQDYKKWGFDKIVALAQLTERIAKGSMATSEFVAEFQNKYPDKVIGLGSTEPLDDRGRFSKAGFEHFEKAIKEYKLKGMMWSPGYGYWYPNEKSVYPFYQLAVELDVPLYYHMATWWPPAANHPLRYGRLYHLDDVIIDFPDLKISIEHMGFPWTDELIALMGRSKNVYTDVSMILPRPQGYRDISLRGPITITSKLVQMKEFGVLDRVMYGSDYFWDPEGLQPHKEVEFIKEGLNATAERCGWPTFSYQEIEGILGKNAMRLFELQ